jgi:hypothetical protein
VFVAHVQTKRSLRFIAPEQHARPPDFAGNLFSTRQIICVHNAHTWSQKRNQGASDDCYGGKNSGRYFYDPADGGRCGSPASNRNVLRVKPLRLV